MQRPGPRVSVPMYLTIINFINISLFRLRRTYEPQLKDLILQTSDVQIKPNYHVCEYIGGPNLALKRPTFCKEEETDYENCKLEWVNDGIFPATSKYWYGDFWHGRGAWVYLQITLDKFYAIKTVIFQSR